MQGEDDLRGLAKIMAFMQAVSILLVLMTFTGSAKVSFWNVAGRWNSSIRY